MTLKSWANLTFQERRNVIKLYAHLQANSNNELSTWDNLDGKVRRSKIRLWNYIATELQALPTWDNLSYRMKLSRKLRWTTIYNSLTGTSRAVTILVKEGDDPLPGATVTIDGTDKLTGTNGKVTFEEVDDGSTSITVAKQYYTTKTESKTVSRTSFSFTISLVHDKRNLSFTVTDGTDPVQGASVAIGEITGTTGSSGGCTLSNVLDGENTVTVTADGYEDYSATITSDSTHSSFEVELTAESP